MTRREIEVQSRDHDYRVVIERGGIERDSISHSIETGLAASFDARSPRTHRQVVIVSDSSVARLHLPTLERALKNAGASVLARIIIEPGEANKSLTTVTHCYDALAKAGARRSTLFVAFGGGVVTDLTGFVAATWQRGAPWLAVPTTLLGQIDAAIGGKTGVDLEKAKNIVGAFHPPLAVVVDPSLLATLPPPELRSGLGELLKYGVLRGGELFDRIVRLGAEAEAARSDLDPLICEAIAIKADLCCRDEFDRGERRLLNLGHTIGHALETAAQYTGLRHGEAVALGMIGEASLAADLGLASTLADAKANATNERGTLDTIAHAAAALGLGRGIERADESFLERARGALALDKKSIGRRTLFALPLRIGEVEIVELDPGEHFESIDRALRRSIRGSALA